MQIKQLVKRLLSNRMVKNGIWLYILQMFNTVIPLVTLPYITRILGAGEYGVFSIAFNLIGYLMVVVEYGFGMSGARKASLAENVSELNKTFTAIIIARLILCVSCFAITLVYGFAIMHSPKQRLCLFLLFLIPLGIVLQQNWLFQGLQRMQYITITSVISRIVSLICIFLFVKTPEDLPWYCVFYAITTIILGITGTYFAVKRIGVRFVKISLEDVVSELESGWYVFTTSLSSKIFNTFGITVLGLMSTEYYVGIYSAIQKLPQMVLLIWSPVAQVLYPVTSKKMTVSFKTGREYVVKVEKYILPLFIAIIILIGILSKQIVTIAFGTEYSTYHSLIYPLLLWLVFGILNNFSGIQTLLAGGYSKEYSRCFLIGVALTILTNLIFVKYWGIWGAAFAPALSEGVFGILLQITVKRIGRTNDVQKREK